MRIFTLLLISLGVYLSIGLPSGLGSSSGAAVGTTKAETMAAETDTAIVFMTLNFNH